MEAAGDEGAGPDGGAVARKARPVQSKRRALMAALGTLAVGYGVLLLIVVVLQEKMIFFPRGIPEWNRSLVKSYEADAVAFENGGEVLRGWLVNREARPLVIYYGGNAEEVSHHLGDRRAFGDGALLLVNYRGYGESTGSPGQDALFSDALAIYDAVTAELGVGEKEVMLVGRSLGSGVATYVASQRKVRRLLLVTPFDSIAHIAADRLPFLPVRWLLRHPFNSVQHAQAVNCTTQIIVAENDADVPPRYAKELQRRWPSPVIFLQVAGAGHNSIGEFTEYREAVREFLSGE